MSEQNEHTTECTEYQKSCAFWISEQETLIEYLKQNISNSEKMIELHGKTLAISKEALEHEEKVLFNFKNRDNE